MWISWTKDTGGKSRNHSTFQGCLRWVTGTAATLAGKSKEQEIDESMDVAMLGGVRHALQAHTRGEGTARKICLPIWEPSLETSGRMQVIT